MNKSLFLLLGLLSLACWAGPDDEKPFIGVTPASDMAEDKLARIAQSEATVLILGETGTGKDVLANRIHALSKRQHKIFMPIHLAAFPEALIESELFGHVRGAFTGADQARRGIFDVASGGTLFLDELGEIPETIQVKLLRVLETGEIKPVGSNDYHKVNVRIIAATNKNLEQAVADGKFRQDLYFRLKVFEIETIPLRERLADLPALSDYFLAKLPGQRKHFSNTALEFMASYPWPGNIRELKSAIEWSVVMAEGDEITHHHLHDRILHYDPAATPIPITIGSEWAGQRLEVILDNFCVQVVAKHGGKYAPAARELDISEKTLRMRVKRAGESESRSRSSESEV